MCEDDDMTLTLIKQSVLLRVNLAENNENQVQIQLSSQTKGFGIKIHMPPQFAAGRPLGPLQGPR